MIDAEKLKEDHAVSIRAEQAVLGALLADNDALDRVAELEAIHFYRADHRLIFEELQRQIMAGQRADAVTLYERLDGRIDDCLRYLATMRQSAVTASGIVRHAKIVIEKADKRSLAAISDEMRELAASHQPAASCIDLMASKLELLVQKKTGHDPERMEDMMAGYVDVLQQRMSGVIAPVKTGFIDLDERLDGGVERGTVTVVAARPGMGKTAFGLCIARNTSMEGGVSAFFSMEMARDQVNDRNVSALGKIPLKWLRKPGEDSSASSSDSMYWSGLTVAITKSRDMDLFIDDETGLNMLEIRAKARKIKRKAGRLDCIVIDQLSFITGGKSDKLHEVVGEYTRALVRLAKELDAAVVLLCQLNRECEKRPNKRPIMADLAMSGSIEQDAANILFLYRDDKYNPDSRDKGLCEVNCEKLRQGEPGVVALAYIGAQTRFESLSYPWRPQTKDELPHTKKKGGFG